MRIVVVGATGNVGTATVQALSSDPEIESVLGLARRKPKLSLPGVEWAEADVATSALLPHFSGADAVIHLAWLIQPSRDERATYAVNVEGSRRLFQAAAQAGVPKLLYASSVGAYSPGPKDHRVREDFPTGGIQTSFYSRHKAEVESILDEFELNHPHMQIVRMRPGLIFQGNAASGIRRLFAGPFLPNRLLRRALIPVVPDVPELRFQSIHANDVADAFRIAARSDARGAFNLAGEPVLDSRRLGRILGAKPVRVPKSALRGAVAASWRARLQPSPPGWLDLALGVPIMDTRRARRELGWLPRHSSGDALIELLEGVRLGQGLPTPPLKPGNAGPLRSRELTTGIGARSH